MTNTRKYFLIMAIVFLLVGLGTLAASDVSINDTAVAKTTDVSNAKVVNKDTNTLKENLKTDDDNLVANTKEDKKQNKDIIKDRYKKTVKTDETYNVKNFTAFQDALSKSGTVNVNVLSDIDLGNTVYVSNQIEKLTINGNSKTINGQGQYQFLYFEQLCDVTISNINIKNCSNYVGSGGAISSWGNLTIMESNFTDNYGKGIGGVINHAGSLTVENSNFTSNNGSLCGGAIAFYIQERDDILNVTGSTFFNNTVVQSGYSEALGGAIYIEIIGTDIVGYLNNSAYITNSKFIANNARSGGAVYIDGGNLYVNDSVFESNTAEYNGAAICSYANLTISNSNFSYNDCEGAAGAIYQTGFLTVEKSNFNNNTAVGRGGAIEYFVVAEDTILNITDSTFFNNTVFQDDDGYSYGGAIVLESLDADGVQFINNSGYITNSKFIANNATTGGAVVTGIDLYINDSIFEDNNASVGGALYAIANLTFANTNCTDNTADYAGGAILIMGIFSQKLTIIDSIFFNNSVLKYDNEFFGGGALSVLNMIGYVGLLDEETDIVPIDIINSKFIENNAYYGGAIHLNGGILTINDTTLENNKAIETGGAVYGTTLTNITSYGSVFTNNVANLGGAIFVNKSSNVLLQNTNLTGNKAIHVGVIFANKSSNVTIEESTLKANTASDGAIITGENLDTIKINNSKFYDNYVSSNAGYVFVLSCAENVIIADTYFENNTDNKRDMLFSDVDKTNVEIHGNTYTDNYLAINMTKLVDSDVRGLKNETLTYPVNVTVRGVYNHTVDSGNVFYKSELTNGSNPVTGGQSSVTLDNAKLLNDTNLVNYNYTSLRKHYQSANASFNVLKEMKDSQIGVTVVDSICGDTKIKINLTSEGNAIGDTPLVITLPDGSTIETKTGSDGTVTVPLDLPAGENNVKIEYDGGISTKPESKTVTVEVNPLSTTTTISVMDSTAGNVVVTGTVTDKFGKNVTEGTIIIKNQDTVVGTVKVNNGTYTVLTSLNSKGSYTIYAEFNGTDNYLASNSTKLTFNVTARMPVIKLDSVYGVIGEDITFTAYLTDDNGTNISGGNLAFKLNGKTLRSDGRFDSSAPAMKFSVKNGLVTYTLKADLYLRNAKNLTASYSGNNMYAETASSSVEAQIQKRKAEISVMATPSKVKQYETVTFIATVKDVTKNAKNTTAIGQDVWVIFKINGKTLKDNNNNTLYVAVDKNGQAAYNYVVSAGTGGVKKGLPIYYNLEAIVVSDNFYPGARNNTTYNIEQSNTTLTIKEVKVDGSNILSVKANITDYKGNSLVGTNKVSIKVNGITLKNETGAALMLNVTNGVVDLAGIQVDSNTTIKRVMLVTGERQAYAGARAETTDIIRV
ncbi:MAG: hypothetical protein BZ138_07745 [Methanosphaera sp. rholeuAM270]|nr:MAG: hypothetical protein BZ138_07745 [Methanosphaera sp. rholeuAM270]